MATGEFGGYIRVVSGSEPNRRRRFEEKANRLVLARLFKITLSGPR